MAAHSYENDSAPIAPQIPFTHDRVTGSVQDPWAWLSDKKNPATIPYLVAENKFADTWFKHRQSLTDEIFTEIKSRMHEDDTSAPVQFGDWWYAQQTIAGAGYMIHTRGKTLETATESLLLDENLEAKQFEFFGLGSFELTADHNFLAWSHETDGSEQFTIKIRDLKSNLDIADTLINTNNSGVVWSHDAQHLFYLTHDVQMRPNKVWRHKIGEMQSQDVLIFQEDDERFNVEISLTRSGEWIIIECSSRITTECRLLSAHDVTQPLALVRPRSDEVEYRLDHWGDQFIVLTNLNALDFRVMTAPISDPNSWTELVAHTPGQRIAHIDTFKSHLILHRWVNAQQTLTLIKRDGATTTLPTGNEPHEVGGQYCPQWDTNTYRYTTESLISPNTVFDHDLLTNQRTIAKTQIVPNVDLSNYVAVREWVTAKDGTRIALDIVRHKSTPLGSNGPGLLYAYGSYEASVPPWFSVARLSLLDRGWVWALAHPRGGGECGRNWYLDGKLLNKRNTFYDINDCARHLYANHVAPGALGVRGGSAGGLMVGACITFEPKLYGAAIAEVPFVDVINSMSDPTLPLTINEWDEWGDPRSEPLASYMLSYSPYDNAISAPYPPMYVTAGLNDPRVCYHEPAKWVAKLRSLGGMRQPLLFNCEMDAGHGGKSDRYDQWRDEAKVLTFLLTVVTPNPSRIK